MHPSEKPAITCYVDASFTRMAAGGGYVARVGDRLILGGFPLEGVHSSNQAEARVARMLVDRLMDGTDPSMRIDVRTDSKFVINSLLPRPQASPETPVKRSRDVTDDVIALEARSLDAGDRLTLGFCKGHVPTGSAAGFLNHCADQLAKLGSTGKNLDWDLPFDAFWRFRIMGCHERLACEGLGLTLSESAEYLGVSPRVVDQLLQHGHIEDIPGRSLISGSSLNVVRRHITERGHQAPLRSEPLPPIRGRLDEPDSGFGAGQPSRSTVQVFIQTEEAGGDVAAIILLEGAGSTEAFALRFPVSDGPVWKPVLDNLLDLVWDRYPDCDRIVAIVSDRDLAEAMNGRGPYNDDPCMADIDEQIQGSEITIEVRPFQQNRNRRLTRLTDGMLRELVDTGVEGAWTVSAQDDQDVPFILAPMEYELPWASDGADLGPRP